MRFLLLLLAGHWLNPVSAAQPPRFDAKKAQASQTLKQVGAAYGFDVLELPKLVLYPKRDNNNRIAKLELVSVSPPQTPTTLDRSRLLMDEELFDICAETDQQCGVEPGTALAFVLAHEMAHFYLKHATFRNFADQRKGFPVPLKSTIESKQQESEADKKGLLFAYLAGYDPEPVLIPLFDKLYSHYHLKDPLPGHPDKAVRQQETKLKAAEYRSYGYLFAIGHALYCREKFAEAARCFEYVYTRYPLKEAYNNYGVCRLQDVIRQKKKTRLDYFALPFEVDPRNRLLRMGERSEAAGTADITKLLDEANTAFGRAIDMDQTYTPAYLNQAIGALLADNAPMAMGILITLSRQAGTTFPPNAYLIRGMAYCGSDNLAKAAADFTVATTKKAYQAGYNQFIFQAIKKGTVKTAPQPWQRLTRQQPSHMALGCQAGTLPLREIDRVPAALRFTTTLIDQNNPLPYLLVSYEQLGPATYFRVELGAGNQRSQPVDLFFVLNNGPSGANR